MYYAVEKQALEELQRGLAEIDDALARRGSETLWPVSPLGASLLVSQGSLSAGHVGEESAT